MKYEMDECLRLKLSGLNEIEKVTRQYFELRASWKWWKRPTIKDCIELLRYKVKAKDDLWEAIYSKWPELKGKDGICATRLYLYVDDKEG